MTSVRRDGVFNSVETAALTLLNSDRTAPAEDSVLTIGERGRVLATSNVKATTLTLNETGVLTYSDTSGLRLNGAPVGGSGGGGLTAFNSNVTGVSLDFTDIIQYLLVDGTLATDISLPQGSTWVSTSKYMISGVFSITLVPDPPSGSKLTLVISNTPSYGVLESVQYCVSSTPYYTFPFSWLVSNATTTGFQIKLNNPATSTYISNLSLRYQLIQF